MPSLGQAEPLICKIEVKHSLTNVVSPSLCCSACGTVLSLSMCGALLLGIARAKRVGLAGRGESGAGPNKVYQEA